MKTLQRIGTLGFGTLALMGALMNSAAAQSTVKIGIPVGLSGANSVVAPSVVQSSQLAADEINAAGGILGKKVELVVADDGSGAQGAQRAFNSLVFQDDVDVLISMETSAARNAGLPIVNRAGKPFIYTSFYEGRSCSPNMFVPAWVPDQQVKPVVDHFTDTLKAKTFYLIGSDYNFGRGMLEFTRKYIEERGGRVLGEEYLPMDGSDWTSIISDLRSKNPNALITSTAGGAPNVTLTKQLRNAGIKIPYGNLAVDEGTAKTMGADATDMFISQSYMTGIASAENKKFLDAMQKKFGGELKTPNDLSVPQYEAIYLYKAAAEKAGSTDAEDVIEALPEVSFTGPRGNIQMNKQHHTPLTMYLGQVKDGGSVEVIKTFENVDPGEQCPNL
ncbi:branched-chain amino acid transport system substrate-binding protein [Skermanella aerolata]|uniref:Urea ABC transporter substrate-binding protein n=1 Tax=Skermanella aerolata TaxID=393310 RepID=A0A512DRP7_9PROT|nr:substrate-binding protein [Skermanella aerolata]KJB93196.1 amino acid ABC transporter [Skermanella aerolata KACC 11604]GEO39163.1 urea ABC transporter substrate-binding protein [Skermanella aerolata]